MRLVWNQKQKKGEFAIRNSGTANAMATGIDDFSQFVNQQGKCMPRNSTRTGELLEGLADPKKIFRAFNRANRRLQPPQQIDKFETDMGDAIDPNGNGRHEQVNLNVRDVAPLVPEGALYDWAQPTTDNLATAIVLPAIQAESFQITNNMLHLLQNKGLFSGTQLEDPQQHLKNFMSICKTQRQPNVTPEAIRLLLFPFSVTGASQVWLNLLPINSIATWDELVKQFHNKFHPPNKTAQQIDEIVSFKQKPMETLHETWSRFKGMLVMCPRHGIPEQMLGQRFYMGLSDGLKNIVDASAGGAFLSKTWREGQSLLDKMAQNSGWTSRNAPITPVVHSVPLDPSNTMAENMATLLTQMSILTKKLDHHHQHPEDMNYVANYGGQRQGNPNWGQQTQQQYRPPPPQYNAGNMGGIRPLNNMAPYPRSQGYNNQQQGYHQPQQQHGGRQDDGFARLEVGQILMSLNNRPQGTLPADTRINPKDQGPKQLMAVSLRNGRDLDEEQEKVRANIQAETLIQHDTEKVAEAVEEPVVEIVAEKEKSQVIGKKRPLAPFPQRLAKHQKEEQYKKFFEMLKQIQ
uniref:Retrotransposon gag domain-containing protein n=1 Tax=Nicotiana tabacum TaxID=4097 RepID=A0A1S4A8A4_TOBAC|nr:PREDICTED: uncharacterized protein LOC107794848 [Nicotiana tabacum]